MSLFSKIKNALEQEEACIISKHGTPLYVSMRWDTYQELVSSKKELQLLQSQQERLQEEEDMYDIDINSIPV